MKFTLPTQHVLYFGIQAKKGKLDAAGVSQAANVNVAEIHNQVTMMLGHEIFNPEIGKRVLVQGRERFHHRQVSKPDVKDERKE